jgi:ATP-dependent Clp protease ATP-binding subunit ClpA
LPFTDSVSSVLNQAKKVSLSCGDSNITSGHLLWGLLKNQDTLGATILKKLGLAGEAAIENLQIALQSEKSLDGYTRRKR